MASGCSSAGNGDLPSNDTGKPGKGVDLDTPSSPDRVIPTSTPVVDDGEESLNLVAAVALPGRLVKFFEPEEGTVLEMELAVDGLTADPGEQGLSGSALYAYLTKTEAPEALLDAEWRANDLATRNGVDLLEERQDVTDVGDAVTSEARKVQTPAGDLPGVRPTDWEEGKNAGGVAKGEAYFLDKYCTPTDRFWRCGGTTTEACGGDSYIERTGVNMMQAGMRSGVSQHTHESRFGLWWYSTTLLAGFLHGWRMTSGINRVARSEGKYAGSGWYDHCVNYHY